MQTAVDKFGRVVIPKHIRQHLGLCSGTKLEIEMHSQKVVFKVLTEKSLLKREKGVLVYTAEAFEDVTEAVQKHRQERLDELSKL